MASAKGEEFPATSDLAASVREFVLKQFPLTRKHRIQNSDPLLESGMIDSMGMLEIVGFIERTYGFTVSDEDLVPENFQTVDAIAGFIQGRVKA
jgi:acyl carrier protein